LTPRFDRYVRTRQFGQAVGLVSTVNGFARRRPGAAGARFWHLLNLAAASDVARLRKQLGATHRELRRLTMQLERERASAAAGDDAPGQPDHGHARGS